jgi:hypothetical protein
MKEWVQQYIKGYRVCQQNKANTHLPKLLLYPITPTCEAPLFNIISINWITKLPLSMGYDSILTITDYNCSKAVLFYPCKETIGTTTMAQLYFTNVFPYYSILLKIISDRDPRLTSQIAKELCQKAQITQNISIAYHPQTDRQLE